MCVVGKLFCERRCYFRKEESCSRSGKLFGKFLGVGWEGGGRSLGSCCRFKFVRFFVFIGWCLFRFTLIFFLVGFSFFFEVVV